MHCINRLFTYFFLRTSQFKKYVQILIQPRVSLWHQNTVVINTLRPSEPVDTPRTLCRQHLCYDTRVELESGQFLSALVMFLFGLITDLEIWCSSTQFISSSLATATLATH